MKKLFIAFTILLLSTFAFAKPFDNEITEKFLQNGTYIKIISDANNMRYIPKCTIVSLKIHNEDLTIYTSGTLDNGHSAIELDTRHYKITFDEYGNLIFKYMG